MTHKLARIGDHRVVPPGDVGLGGRTDDVALGHLTRVVLHITFRDWCRRLGVGHEASEAAHLAVLLCLPEDAEHGIPRRPGALHTKRFIYHAQVRHLGHGAFHSILLA